MIISVRGIGWLTTEGYGCVRSGLKQIFESGEGPQVLPKRGIFSHPFKNFGRLDNLSRMTAYCVALALQDAGIEYSPGKKQDIGSIGTNAQGSLRADVEYYRDYIDSGRTLSRGNLFIYTLPSSPLGEAAIHFGFLGPLLYAADEGHSLAVILDTAGDMILAGETRVMLAGKADENKAVYFVLEGGAGRGPTILCDLSDARSIVQTGSDVAGMVRKFSLLAAGKA